MIRKVWLALAVIFALVIGGCSNGTTNTGGNQTGKYAQEFRGEWIRMDTGQRWYISGDSIKVDDDKNAPNVTLQKTSENVITATDAGDKYILFAARTANASFNAQVVLLDDSSRSVLGRAAGGQMPNVRITNPKQTDFKPLVVQPDSSGRINVGNQIPRDPLVIIPDSSEWGNVKVELIPDFGSGQNMGVIPITKGDSFKVSLISDSSVTDYYADGNPRDYVFELENIGATTCGDSGWELSWIDNEFTYVSGKKEEDFANIRPGEKKRLTVRLASKPIEYETENKKILINIWNYDSKSKEVRRWEDAVSISYSKAPVPLRFSSEKQVQGVIKAKKGKSYYFKTNRIGTAGDYTATVYVPWSSDEYTIAFLGATIESGSATKYSFAVNSTPLSNWSSLKPADFLEQYKPNNEYENTAPKLDLGGNDKSFMGYLAGDSIDYYKVKLGNTPPEIQLYTVTFDANGASIGAPPQPVTVISGDNIQLPNPGIMIKNGNVFGGWNTDSSGTGTNYNAGSSFSVNGNVTLYAKWDPLQPRTITFDANGATSGTAPEPVTVNIGSRITLPSGSELTKTGYVFGGWNTNSSGTGTNYTAGSSFTVNNNVTLYAKWNTGSSASVSIEMVQIHDGSFQMGSNDYYSEQPVHTVTLGGFYMGKYEVTQEQYQAVMGNNPSYFPSSPASGEVQSKRPVEQVSWYDALVFCNKLSMKEGLSPAYKISGSTDPASWGTVPTSSNSTWNAVEIVSGSTGYRLPTEAQWEYAAREGNGSPGNYTYSGSDTIDDVAWYESNSDSKTHEVGKKSPNGLGLYDMSGNVWEWCLDRYGDYTSGAQTDPLGASSGSLRVVRGGGWINSAKSSTSRSGSSPNERVANVGFRLVRPNNMQVSIEMVQIPGGTFTMGSPKNEPGRGTDETQHSVTLSGFSMGKYQVTQEQWTAVMGSNPSNFTSSPASGEVQGKRPVEKVSWYDALVFCNKLSMKEELSPAYKISGSTDPASWGTVPTSSNSTWDAVEIVASSTGYRLPTEAQWEYAARGGNGSPGNYTYSGSNTVGDVAWYEINSISKTHEVGKKAPNGLGLYDMSGNVCEWCWDWYSFSYYSSSPANDPGGADSGSYRVYRGGSWVGSAAGVRSSCRSSGYPRSGGNGVGFRLVRP